MKQKFLLKTMLLLSALIAGSGSAWGQTTPYYTLEPVATGGNSSPHNTYTAEATTEINGIEWAVTGNSYMVPWRIGGKASSSSTTATLDVSRTVYTATAMGTAIESIKLYIGDVTVNTFTSVILTVSSKADFSSVTDEITESSPSANSTLTFSPTSGTNWDSGLYYKFTINATLKGKSNTYIQFSKVEFYEYTGGSGPTTYTVTYNGNGATSGTVPTDETAYSSGETVTVLGNTGGLAKTYCTFDGWNTKADGTGIDYAPSSTFSITANTTLYAKWTDTRASAGLSWSAASADVTYGAANVFPTLTNPHSVPVTYSSTVTAAATIDGSGVITLKDVTSSTVISAIFAGNDDYLPQTVSYTLNVTEGEFVLEDGVFNFVKAANQSPLEDYGSGVTLTSSEYTKGDKTWTAGNVTMVTNDGGGNGIRWWSADGTLRFYNKAKATFSVPSGYVITKIVTTGANFNSANAGTLSGATWKGASNSVELSVSDTRNIKTITVTYTTENQSVTITDATGYATYCSPYALDFTDKVIKAYIAKAKADYSGVTFEQVNKVPANTGVLLYKSGGTTENIPVFDGKSADDVTDNVFKPGKGATLPSVDGDLHNYILNKVGGVVGFYKANNQMVATNRAYIQIDESKVYVKEFISLPGFDDDDATGIRTIDNGQLTIDNEIYNLAGQRLNKIQKGINIVNGKKILK